MDALLAEEFESFVRARTPALLRSAYLLTGNQQLAEDLVQDALARTHRAWRKLHQTSNAEAYARKTMYHLQVSWWRKRRVAESFLGEVPDKQAAAGDLADRVVTRLSLREALNRLPARQRAVIVLRFFDDLTEAQSAEILGVTVGTIKSQTAKALNRLRATVPQTSETFATGSIR